MTKTYFTTLMSDGMVNKIERGKSLLKNRAVYLMFPN